MEVMLITSMELTFLSNISNSIMSSTPISSRLISIQIAARPIDMAVIEVHAPTMDYDELMETFYEGLGNTVPKMNFLVIQGN